MKISCPICYEHQSADEYYRMTVHKEEYHKLLQKIQEKIKENDIADPEQMRVVDVLESLLEDEK